MAESVNGLGFSCICRAGKGHGNTKQVQTNLFRAFGGGLKQGIDGKSGMRSMAENVGHLGFSCICRAGERHGNTKRVRTNSFRAFGGGLTQGIDGKSGMRGDGCECRPPFVFVYP
jgi:hypothetical protein